MKLANLTVRGDKLRILSRFAKFNPGDMRTHRYLLHAQMTDGPRMMAALLFNPSTADENTDDPTSSRVWDFFWRWGADGGFIINPFAGIATKPADLFDMPDPVGEANDGTIDNVCNLVKARDGLVLLGYGVLADSAPKPMRARAWERVHAVRQRIIASGVRVCYLSKSHEGHPRHPLYIEAECEPKDWREPAVAATPTPMPSTSVVATPATPPAPVALSADGRLPEFRRRRPLPGPAAAPVVATVPMPPVANSGPPRRRAK